MDSDQKILKTFIESHPKDAARLVEGYSIEERTALLESLPLDLSAQLIGQMDRYAAALSFEKINFDVAIRLLEKLPLPITEALLRQMNEASCNAMLNELDPELSEPLKRVLAYSKSMVGAYLEPVIFTLTEDLTVGQSLERIKKENPPLLSHVFVLSAENVLVGVIELKHFITSEKSKTIRSVMDTNPPKTQAKMNISVLIEGRGWNDAFPYLGVVDADGFFLGLVTREAIAKINAQKTSYNRQAAQASSALGDLYQIGISSLFKSATELSESQKSK